jgi:DNA-binding CsgD family transcriptional regulator
MNSMLAKCIGLTGKPQISIDAAIILLSREGGIRRCEARIAVYDYLGLQREDMCEQFNVAPGTIDKYWGRIYDAIGCRGREAARAWVAELLELHGV